MSYDYVVDSYAWIEYFRGSEAGKKARGFIEGGKAAIATIAVAELREKYAREDWTYFDEDLLFITSSSAIVNLTKDIAVMAGETNVAMKAKMKGWGMADSITLATAQVAKAKVVTGDKHFKGLKQAILI
jgi:predicted nucleic acid-binding protein